MKTRISDPQITIELTLVEAKWLRAYMQNYRITSASDSGIEEDITDAGMRRLFFDEMNDCISAIEGGL